MKKIQLGGHNKVRGEYHITGFAIVDDNDFSLLSKYKWHLAHGYAATHIQGKVVYMHRLVNKTPIGGVTDHINRNPLDNQKSNLRTVNKSVNSINTGLQANNTSGHKGVSWNKQHNGWETYIWKNRCKIPLGIFKEIKKAVETRRTAEMKYHAI